jgi:hypothetical protein
MASNEPAGDPDRIKAVADYTKKFVEHREIENKVKKCKLRWLGFEVLLTAVFFG